MGRTIHCSVIEVGAMSDMHGSSRGFRDLVPWADPYIASLMEKLRRSMESTDPAEFDGFVVDDLVGELPPPLDNSELEHESPWNDDWAPRGWPGE